MRRSVLPVRAMTGTIALLLCIPAVASQSLESGALFTITGTVNTTPPQSLNLAVYDSQIHSTIVQTSPCDSLVTDAYILQGGSPTGCDNGDTFETAQAHGTFKFVGNGYEFDITTSYQFGGCNTSGNICASPDTGFLTITNKGRSSFTGTMTLSGNSPTGGGPFCAAGGVASDSFTGTFGPGTPPIIFALAKDSSNCGGYKASQTQPLSAGGTAIFPVGTDDYEIAPLNNAGAEQITLLPVPVLQSSSNPGSNASNTFNPGPMFSTFSCAPYGDFSEPGNPICVEFQLSCSGADCEFFLYQVTTHYSLPQGINGLGGPGFLKASNQLCTPNPPQPIFDKNILLFFSQDTISEGGGDGLSCFAAAFTPNAPIVDSFLTFVGFAAPVSNTQINVIQAGSAEPLIWQQFIAPNIPNTNLTFCSSPNPAAGACTAPWVNLATIPIICPNGPAVQPATQTTISAGGSGLQNEGNGNYQFNWKTVPGTTGCVRVVATFDSGLVVYPATFQYK